MKEKGTKHARTRTLSLICLSLTSQPNLSPFLFSHSQFSVIPHLAQLNFNGIVKTNKRLCMKWKMKTNLCWLVSFDCCCRLHPNHCIMYIQKKNEYFDYTFHSPPTLKCNGNWRNVSKNTQAAVCSMHSKFQNSKRHCWHFLSIWRFFILNAVFLFLSLPLCFLSSISIFSFWCVFHLMRHFIRRPWAVRLAMHSKTYAVWLDDIESLWCWPNLRCLSILDVYALLHKSTHLDHFFRVFPFDFLVCWI